MSALAPPVPTPGARQSINEAQFYKVSGASTYQPPELSHVVSRSTVKVLPQNGGSGEFSSRGSRLIRIALPATGFLDTQNSFLQFKFQAKTVPKYLDQTIQ